MHASCVRILVKLTWIANNANDVTTADNAVDGLEIDGSVVARALGHNLQLLALALDVVKDEALSGAALELHTASNTDSLTEHLLVLQVLKLAVKIGEGDADGELVRVGLHGAVSLELLHHLAAHLKVLVWAQLIFLGALGGRGGAATLLLLVGVGLGGLGGLGFCLALRLQAALELVLAQALGVDIRLHAINQR